MWSIAVQFDAVVPNFMQIHELLEIIDVSCDASLVTYDISHVFYGHIRINPMLVEQVDHV